MRTCEGCFKDFEKLEDLKDGVEIYKFCKSCLEKYKNEPKHEGGDDNYSH